MLAKMLLLETSIFPIQYALDDWPMIEITGEIEKSITNGQVLPIHPLLETNEKIVLLKMENHLQFISNIQQKMV